MTDPTANQTPDPWQTLAPVRRPGVRARIRTGPDRLEELYARTVLAAPLAVAGWFQSHAAHERLGLPWGLAIAFTVAWEGAAAYCALLYHRTLVAGDSTVMLRLGMLGYSAASCGLLWWHLNAQGKPWYLAAAVGVLTLSGIYLWSRRARWLRRDDLRKRGMVDAQVVRFSVAAWFAAPIETPRALRYAIKNRISHPIEAIEAYRADRTRRRTVRALARARRAAARRGTAAVKSQTPQPDPVVRQTPIRAEVRTPQPASTPDRVQALPSAADRPARQARPAPAEQARAPRTLQSADDAQALGALRRWRTDNDGQTPSLDQTQKILACGRSRAVRVRGLFASAEGSGPPQTDRSDDDREDSPAAPIGAIA